MDSRSIIVQVPSIEGIVPTLTSALTDCCAGAWGVPPSAPSLSDPTSHNKPGPQKLTPRREAMGSTFELGQPQGESAEEISLSGGDASPEEEIKQMRHSHRKCASLMLHYGQPALPDYPCKSVPLHIPTHRQWHKRNTHTLPPHTTPLQPHVKLPYQLISAWEVGNHSEDEGSQHQ